MSECFRAPDTCPTFWDIIRGLPAHVSAVSTTASLRWLATSIYCAIIIAVATAAEIIFEWS